MASSSHNFDALIGKVVADYGDRETEHNWERLEGSFKRAAELVPKVGAEAVAGGLRRIRGPLTTSLLTERTRLALAAMEFVKAACLVLGMQSDQFAELLLPPLLKLCERTNRVFVLRAQQTLSTYIGAAPVARTLVPRFAEAMKSPNKGLRGLVAEGLCMLLPLCSAEAVGEYGEVLERVLVEALGDASPQVRETSRRIYFGLATQVPESARRVLERAAPPIQRLLAEGPKAGGGAAGGLLLKRTVTAARAGAGAAAGPSRVLGATVPHPLHPAGTGTGIGNAQRVLKTGDSPALTPGAKAARVTAKPAHSATPVKPSGLRASASAADTGRPAAPSLLASCVSAGNLPSASVRTEIVGCVAAARSPDWAVRLGAFDALAALLGDGEARGQVETSRSASQRLFDVLLVGLADTHFRVLEAVVRYATVLLGVCPVEGLPEPAMAEGILAKAVYVAVNPQFRGKACQEAVPAFVDALGAWVGPQWRFVAVLAAAYAKPEATTSVRARTWIMGRLTREIELVDLGLADSELIFQLKGVIGRVTPALLDHDQALVAQAVGFFAVLQQRLANDVLLDALIALVKFSQARAVLAERMQRPVKSGTASAAPSVADTRADEDLGADKDTRIGEDMRAASMQVGNVPTENLQAESVQAEGMQVEDMRVDEDMRIDEGDEPITVEEYVLLDEELGIELRVRPRPALLSVEGLSRSLSSVLRSPFTHGGSESEAEGPSADEIQMAAIEPALGPAGGVLAKAAEENPFL